MSTNYNQLLKDLEIGSVYVKILICFLGCTFMLYPFLFYFTHFFRELSVYEQIFFTLGSSALYTGIGIPLSAISFRYPAFYYAPLLLLTATVCLCVYLHLAVWSYVSKMTLLCFLLFLEYLICGIAGIILTFKKKENPKNDIDY